MKIAGFGLMFLGISLVVQIEIVPAQNGISEYLAGFILSTERNKTLNKGKDKNFDYADIMPGTHNKERGEKNSSETVYLTLDEACMLALKNNFDIQLAKFDAQFKQTDLDALRSLYDTVIEAETKFSDDETLNASSFAGTKTQTNDYNFALSKRLPSGTTLEMDFDNQRSWTNSGWTTLNPAYESTAKLSLRQELGKNFFGIKDRSDLKITRIDIQNAQYTSLDKIEQLLSDVQRTYWRIAQYLNVVKLNREMLLEARKLFEINKEKITKGLIEKPELISSESNLRQREIDLLLAKNQLGRYINELKFLLNLENRDKLILPKEDFAQSRQKIELKKSLKAAFSQRRDYLKAKNEAKAKKIKLVMKKSNLFPEINLEASVARNGLNDKFSRSGRDVVSKDNSEYALSLKIKFPLENREAKSEFNKAKIEKARALLNLKKLECRILIDIKDNVRDCNVLGERLERQLSVVKLEGAKFREELKNYRYGRSDTDTVINYQDDLLLSELRYNQALLDYKEALIELSLEENSLLNRYWSGSL